MKTSMFKQTGSMLIEALVALVVVGVGTFGVVKLNTVMLKGTGESKTRAEALQLAQMRIEDVRNFSVVTGCPAAEETTEADAVTGVNATYKIGRTIGNVIPGRASVDVDVYVGWDGESDPRESATDKQIVLSTVVACLDVGTSGRVGGNASALNGNTLKTPTGSAKVGGRPNPTCTGSCTSVNNNTNGKPDNTKVYTTGKLVELVDMTTNKVLLTVEDGSEFSTISGRVYIETDNSGDSIVDPDGSTANDGSEAAIADDLVFLLSSDASYCARVFPTDAESKIPSTGSGGTIKYRYFDYNCYVSKGWWGNIGIVRLDNPNDNNRVCVGDLAVPSSETSIWSKKPQLSISRGYRAYRKTNPGGSDAVQTNFETTGIGFSLLNNGTVSTEYEAVHLGTSTDSVNHDFLITVINGQGTCESSGKMKLLPGDTNASNQFTSNLGKFYCMSGQCPALTETTTIQTTVVSGTISVSSGAVLTGIDPADCQVTPSFGPGTAANTYTYSCTKIWTGFAGSAWQGGVTFTTPTSPTTGSASTICSNSNGSVATVSPSGSTVASTVNDKLASPNPNSLSFSDVPLGVTSITIDFDAKATSCEKLGQPQTSWKNGSQPYDLTWTAITGATGYKVSTCTSSSEIACTPISPVTQTALFVSPIFPNPTAAGVQTKCYLVNATHSSGLQDDSNSVTAKCVTRRVTAKNNGFTSDYSYK
jgi:hypothetical protein